MKRLIFIVILFYTTTTIAQFLPGDAGYNYDITKTYAKNKIQYAYMVLDSTSDGYGERGDTVAVMEYNKNGYLIKETFFPVFEEDDTLITVYTYSPDNKINLITMYGYDMFPVETGFEYEKGKLVKGYHASAEARDYIYHYNDDGQLISVVGKSAYPAVDDQGESTGEIIWVETDKNEYTWNADGTLKNDRNYYQNTMNYIFSFDYNEQGLLIMKDRHYVPEMAEMSDPDKNSPEMRTIIEYNDKDVPVKITQVNYQYGEYYEHSFVYRKY